VDLGKGTVGVGVAANYTGILVQIATAKAELFKAIDEGQFYTQA